MQLLFFFLMPAIAVRVTAQKTVYELEQYLKSDSFANHLKSDNINETCQEHIQLWINGMRTGEIWALQMIDSMTKVAEGIFLGRRHIPGVFDECIQVRNSAFNGKHCMLETSLRDDSRNATANKSELPYLYGICVPSTCTAEDLNGVLGKIEELDYAEFKNLTENDCSTGEYRPLRTEDWITIIIIITVLSIALTSTLYDITQRFGFKNEKPNQLFISFSVYTNAKSLFRISQGGSQLKCLHGIRFFSITWVVLGHTYITYSFGPLLNAIDVPTYFERKSLVPVNNAFVAVDTFFFLSGLLVCIVFFRDISRKGTFDVPIGFIHRYIRVTPPFAFMMILQATIISRIGNGPFWSNIDSAEKNCRDTWWAGLAYVQNYAKTDANCLGQSWYLSADMQMFWISPLILYPLLFWPALAPYVLFLLLSAAVSVNFAVAYKNDLDPSFSVSFRGKFNKQFEVDYIPTHMRLSPWVVGVAAGYIICGIQSKKIKFNLSKTGIMLGWIFGLSVCGGSYLGVLRFYSSEFTSLEASLYLALHRVGWALSLSWVVIACVSGYGGPINYILSLDVLQPLAKLSYCTFLIHMTIQYYRVYTTRTNQYVRDFEIVYTYFGDLVVAFAFSIPLFLLFECPFTSIDRYFLQNAKILPFPKPKTKSNRNGQKKNNPEDDLEKGKDNPDFKDS